MNTLDIIIIIIVVIAIIALVAITLNSFVDNKLSNISVNIPPINMPDPQITVKVQKQCGSENYDIFIDKPSSKSVSIGAVKTDNNEHFGIFKELPGETKKEEKINASLFKELPGETKKEEKINASLFKEMTGETKNIKINSTNNKTTSGENMRFPDLDNYVEYGGSNDELDITLKCKQSNGKFICTKDNPEIKKKHDKTFEEGTCRNRSLDKQRIDAYGHLTQNSNRKYTACNNDGNPINDEEIDINEYYRKFTKYVRPHLEDPILRGYNVDGFSNIATLDQIGKIQLDDGPKNPKPLGYIFETSAAYKK